MIIQNNQLISEVIENNDYSYLVIDSYLQIVHYFSGIVLFDDLLIDLTIKERFIKVWGKNFIFYFGLTDLQLDQSFIDNDTNLLIVNLLNWYFNNLYHPFNDIIR